MEDWISDSLLIIGMCRMLHWIHSFLFERILKVWTDINFLLAHVRFMLFVLVHLQSNLIFICSLIAEQYDVKVSVNDIIIKVVAAALRNVPEANGK
jgi:hypothetical protein